MILNVSEMKEIFYKRFGASHNFLYYTFEGVQCTLLGGGENEVRCMLSMGAEMFSRKLNGNMIKFRDISSDRHFDYQPGTPPEIFVGREKHIAELISSLGNNITGAEILYRSTAPKFAEQENAFDNALKASVLKASGITPAPRRNGCCTYGGMDYPLPLTGFKVVTAYCRNGARRLKNHSAHDEAETARVSAALRGLSAFSANPLFDAMNESERSIEYYHLQGEDLRLICRIASRINGVAAARCTNNCAVIIVRDNCVDYAMNIIKNDFEKGADYIPAFCISKAI